MRKVFRGIVWLAGAFLIYKILMWSYLGLTSKDQAPPQVEVHELDKVCNMDADTGACICRHRQTGERLQLPYSECKERALNPRG